MVRKQAGLELHKTGVWYLNAEDLVKHQLATTRSLKRNVYTFRPGAGTGASLEREKLVFPVETVSFPKHHISKGDAKTRGYIVNRKNLKYFFLHNNTNSFSLYLLPVRKTKFLEKQVIIIKYKDK